MKRIIKIALIGGSAPVREALAEAASHHDRLTIVEDPGAADVLLAASQKVFLPGIPLISWPLKTKARLGYFLQQALLAGETPAAFLEDQKIKDALFKPQEKEWRKIDGTEIPLTDREVDMLVFFLRNHDQPVSKEDLLQDVWHYQEGVDTHTVETHVYRLRQKIENDPENPAILATEEKGYMLKLKG